MASWDWIQYWLKADNHMCNPCWLKKYKKEHAELEYKNSNTMPIVEVRCWPDDLEGGNCIP